jgi:hypothetical protein
MSQYRFELASEADDADLRRILAETPMDGQISVSFCREPSYFAAAAVDGGFRQIVAARDVETGRIVGFGSRSIRERFVNGQPRPIGYLSNLRLLPAYRNRGLVARGYRFFRELHSDGRAQLYLTTIAAGNETALRLLTSGRAGLPAYHFAGDFHTLAIPVPKRRRVESASSRTTVRQALTEDLPNVLAFLAEHGPRRQFFPRYRTDEFFTSEGTFKNLQPTDLFLAFRGERLVGTLGAWDQHGFRQSVVRSYRGVLRWARPAFNGWARLRGRSGLPSPGQSFRYLVAALLVVADNDVTVFAALLERLLIATSTGAANFLLLGLHKDDPLLPMVHGRETACYTTRLYYVCWDDGESLRNELDARPPYLELGSL